MSNSPIKVLLVEDSPVALVILQRLLKFSSEIKVVATATNGKEALKLIPKTDPHVICTDLYMAGMNGLELTKEIMAQYARPILVISNAVGKKDECNTFQLLQAGAVDVFPKPSGGLASDYEKVRNDLINKIKVVSGVSVFTKSAKSVGITKTKLGGALLNSSPLVNLPKIEKQPKNILQNKTPFNAAQVKLITIGVSTGGPKSLHQILTQLPKNFPVPIICTQHISTGFLLGLVNWLNNECAMEIKIAQPGEMPLPGTVYFAPDNYHLEFNSQGKFVISKSNLVDGHCPSATVMFNSIAKFYRRHTIAIILTGMGRDGASGMAAINKAGGVTIAQNEESCVIFGMPKEAIALGAVQHILPLTEIAHFLLEKLKIKL